MSQSSPTNADDAGGRTVRAAGGGQTSNDRMEALVVGIDAGCLRVLDRLSEKGVVPTFDEIRTEGACAPLQSQIPPWTPSAWPSLYTGVNPGKHGVFGFVTYEGYDWRVVTGDDVREFTLWELLDRYGFTSVVVNAPVTHPPADIDGAIIPGFIGPKHPRCHPEGILDELRAELGEYDIYLPHNRGDESVSWAEKKRAYVNATRSRGEAFRYLAGKYEPDFGFVQFQRTDTVFHEFGDDWELIGDVYAEVDRQLRAIREEYDPKRLFIVSDHGIGPFDRYQFHGNEFLADEGYVRVKAGGKGMPSWGPIRESFRAGHDSGTWEPTLAERAFAKAARFGLTARRIRRVLEQVGLADFAIRYAPRNVRRTGNRQVDFPVSTAYFRTYSELGVRINLQGREPEGIVPPEAYETVREELIEALRAVEAPDGKPVFEEVVPRERYFYGPYAEDAVDIVTVPNGFEYFLSEELYGDHFMQQNRWDHKRDGLFIAAGEGIDAAALGASDEPHLFDVAPTVLSAMGLPYSDRMDGRVLPIVEDLGARSFPEYDAVVGDAVEHDPGVEVEERLADLGYLG